MNKEYQYKDGKIIVKTKKNEKKDTIIMEPTDNIDNLLIQQNIIEKLENELEEKKSMKFHKFIITIMNVILGILATPLAALAIISIIACITYPEINLIAFTAMIMCADAMPIILMILIRHINKLFYKGIDLDIKYLEERLENEKNKLIEIKNEKTKTKTLKEGYRRKKLDELKELRNELLIIEETNSNIKEYYKLQENGNLETKLQQNGYNDNEIKIATNYIKKYERTLK